MATLTYDANELAILVPNLEPDELTLMAKLAFAQALLAAPCLAGDDLTDLQVLQAQGVIYGAIQRWYMQTTPSVHLGAGDFTIGPQGAGINGERKSMFLLSEEDDLREICNGGRSTARVISSWVI